MKKKTILITISVAVIAMIGLQSLALNRAESKERREKAMELRTTPFITQANDIAQVSMTIEQRSRAGGENAFLEGSPLFDENLVRTMPRREGEELGTRAQRREDAAIEPDLMATAGGIKYFYKFIDNRRGGPYNTIVCLSRKMYRRKSKRSRILKKYNKGKSLLGKFNKTFSTKKYGPFTYRCYLYKGSPTVEKKFQKYELIKKRR